VLRIEKYPQIELHMHTKESKSAND